MKKKSFVMGAIILGVASVLCKIIGAIFRIPLTHLLGTEGVGIYQLVFPIYALFLVFASSGVPVSLSKIIAKENSNENYKNIKVIFRSALILMLILGLVFTIFLVIFSKVFAVIQNNAEMYILYLALAPSLLFSTIISAYRGYFQGFQVMTYSAISQILEQLFKLFFGLIFAYFLLPFGLIYGVLGAILGITLSELFSLIYLFVCYKKKKGKIIKNENKDVEVYTTQQSMKLIIKEAFPITLSAIIVPFTSVIDSLIIVKLLSNVGFSFEISSALYGLDSGVVASLINLPSVIAISIGISLMPSISASFSLKNEKDVSFKSKLALKIVWYFTLPCVLIFFLYPTEICRFLYGNLSGELFNQLNVASLMLKISSFSIIYIAINQIVTTSLQAINKSYVPVFVVLFTSVLKVILTIILVLNNSINIYGLVFAEVITIALASIINLTILKKYIKLNFNFKEVFIVPILSLSVMGILLLIFKNFIINPNRILTLVIIGSSFLVYLIMVVLLKGFSKNELSKTTILNFIKKKKY